MPVLSHDLHVVCIGRERLIVDDRLPDLLRQLAIRGVLVLLIGGDGAFGLIRFVDLGVVRRRLLRDRLHSNQAASTAEEQRVDSSRNTTCMHDDLFMPLVRLGFEHIQMRVHISIPDGWTHGAYDSRS